MMPNLKKLTRWIGALREAARRDDAGPPTAEQEARAATIKARSFSTHLALVVEEQGLDVDELKATLR